ncbi:pectinesterase inhibitor 3 [Medicago truncatula]|uniref:pectinesterase inhibitor 3 n=1 Tax=Medicago truncatula TaxID=3880 RepID=UPI001967D8E6|nr:pectinesterase inhibitor 3 [Medicago truncatula]
MQTNLTLTTLFLYFFISTFSTSILAHDEAQTQDLVHSSCIHSRYPKLCLRTLSNYTGPTKSPLDIAQAALHISLAHAKRVSKYLRSSKSEAHGSNSSLSKRQQAGLSDCKEQIADSVDELGRSLEELQMSNALTWVSAALTDGDTCLDGNVRADVKKRVSDVARVTSNALYLINRVGQSWNGKHKVKDSSRSKN